MMANGISYIIILYSLLCGLIKIFLIQCKSVRYIKYLIWRNIQLNIHYKKEKSLSLTNKTVNLLLMFKTVLSLGLMHDIFSAISPSSKVVHKKCQKFKILFSKETFTSQPPLTTTFPVIFKLLIMTTKQNNIVSRDLNAMLKMVSLAMSRDL